MRDTLGRSINYLRISVTDLCNMRCRYCMPEEGISKKEQNEILSLEEIFQVVKAASELGVNKVRITGGEPLVRKDLLKLVEDIASLGTIKDLALTTNGTLLKKYARGLKEAGLNRVNISLDTLNEAKYKEITRGGQLTSVIEGLEEAKKVGLLPLKINVVLIGGFNDGEIRDFVQLTMNEPIDVRFIELMPIGQAAGWAKTNFISNYTVKEQIIELIPIYTGDRSSPAKYYKLPNGKGKVGLINPISSHFCKYCNRMRLTADGRLKPCLHSNQEVDVKLALRSGLRDLKDIMEQAILAKPAQHRLNDQDNEPIHRDMFRIGG
ncbi:GTP 3',8-cyclase MoaA [Geosporobacter ferrireducens]|uniref:GTP 3',8-cyclase MoaA n=1 Tax=Geosporobacter ferrireducens TaxID=1424294 RepID=UPI00139BEC29|nr:GTP 3',8-cyclase MoaA [Geosporobacter ferrireducens]MTI55544.1 GTP 3',8-cyclase MoaA [Geosporobacter ferrireducens]